MTVRNLSSLGLEITAIFNWSCKNKMIINAKTTKDMWICFSELIDELPSIHIGDEIIERVNVFKLLWCLIMGLFNNYVINFWAFFNSPCPHCHHL